MFLTGCGYGCAFHHFARHGCSNSYECAIVIWPIDCFDEFHLRALFQLPDIILGAVLGPVFNPDSPCGAYRIMKFDIQMLNEKNPSFIHAAIKNQKVTVN